MTLKDRKLQLLIILFSFTLPYISICSESKIDSSKTEKLNKNEIAFIYNQFITLVFNDSIGSFVIPLNYVYDFPKEEIRYTVSLGSFDFEYNKLRHFKFSKKLDTIKVKNAVANTQFIHEIEITKAFVEHADSLPHGSVGKIELTDIIHDKEHDYYYAQMNILGQISKEFSFYFNNQYSMKFKKVNGLIKILQIEDSMKGWVTHAMPNGLGGPTKDLWTINNEKNK